MSLRTPQFREPPSGEVIKFPNDVGKAIVVQSDGSLAPTSIGGGAIPLPGISHIIFVSQVFGSDTTGNGSMSAPYQTIAHAYSTITDAAANKIYEIVVFQGTYVAAVALKPFINLVGWESSDVFENQYPTIINGNVTLDASFSTVASQTAITNIDVQGTVTLDFVAASANSAIVSFTNCQLEDAVAITATNEISEFHGCTLVGDFTQHGGTVVWENTVGTEISKTLTVAARTATAATFNAYGSSWTGELSADQNGIAGVPVELTLVNSSVQGPVTVTSTGANVPVINSEYGALPENPTLAGSSSVGLSSQMRVFVPLGVPSGTVMAATSVTDVLLPLAGSVLGSTSIESLSWTFTAHGAAWGTQAVANHITWSFYVVQNGGTAEVHAAFQNPTDTPVTTGANLDLLAYGFLPVPLPR